MTIEQELKLHVPKDFRQAVKEAVNTTTAETIHLHAFYFDTPGRELARAGIALRLRKEQGIWIQTIKLPGDDSLSKVEYNHPRPEATLDLDLYAGTPAEKAFSELSEALETRFETDIQRTLRLQESSDSVIELAFDIGTIRSGSLEIPVCELEFELKEGSSAAIFNLAEVWQQQHHFILDFRSKAERGDTLANAVREATQLDSSFKLWRAWEASDSGLKLVKDAAPSVKKDLQAYIEQVARNAAIIAGIDRVDIDNTLVLDLSKHRQFLIAALEKIQLLCSSPNNATAKDRVPEMLIQQLQQYHHELSAISSTAAQQQVTELVSSADFQQWLLKIYAWTITGLAH